MKGFIEVTVHTYTYAEDVYFNDKRLIPIKDITSISKVKGLEVLNKRVKTKETYEEIKQLIINAQK